MAEVGDKMEARCMRCKGPKEMTVKEINTMKNGGKMAKGECVDCGCTMCKILPKDAAPMDKAA